MMESSTKDTAAGNTGSMMLPDPEESHQQHAASSDDDLFCPLDYREEEDQSSQEQAEQVLSAHSQFLSMFPGDQQHTSDQSSSFAVSMMDNTSVKPLEALSNSSQRTTSTASSSQSSSSSSTTSYSFGFTLHGERGAVPKYWINHAKHRQYPHRDDIPSNRYHDDSYYSYYPGAPHSSASSNATRQIGKKRSFDCYEERNYNTKRIMRTATYRGDDEREMMYYHDQHYPSYQQHPIYYYPDYPPLRTHRDSRPLQAHHHSYNHHDDRYYSRRSDSSASTSDDHPRCYYHHQHFYHPPYDPSSSTSSTSNASNDSCSIASSSENHQDSTYKKPPHQDKSSSKRRPSSTTRRIPGKPKRPLSAYNLFFKDARARILKENKNQGVGGFAHLAQTISKEWKQISEPVLAKYKDLAEQDMKRYRAEMAHFQAIRERQSKDVAEEEQRKTENQEEGSGSSEEGTNESTLNHREKSK